jgi:hypothetical protein
VTGRDKDATWCSLSTHCRALGWSKARAIYELQNGLCYRTVPPPPPGCVIDWHNPDVTHGLDVETGDLTLCLGVFGGPGWISFDTPTVSIEVLPSTDALPAPSLPLPVAVPRKNVSEAGLRNCILAIVAERPSNPPDEEELWAEVEKRLGAAVSRDRIRQARDEVAPEWKLAPGRPRKSAQ